MICFIILAYFLGVMTPIIIYTIYKEITYKIKVPVLINMNQLYFDDFSSDEEIFN